MVSKLFDVLNHVKTSSGRLGQGLEKAKPKVKLSLS
jgi:hypothetical protein